MHTEGLRNDVNMTLNIILRRMGCIVRDANHSETDLFKMVRTAPRFFSPYIALLNGAANFYGIVAQTEFARTFGRGESPGCPLSCDQWSYPDTDQSNNREYAITQIEKNMREINRVIDRVNPHRVDYLIAHERNMTYQHMQLVLWDFITKLIISYSASNPDSESGRIMTSILHVSFKENGQSRLSRNFRTICDKDEPLFKRNAQLANRLFYTESSVLSIGYICHIANQFFNDSDIRSLVYACCDGTVENFKRVHGGIDRVGEHRTTAIIRELYREILAAYTERYGDDLDAWLSVNGRVHRTIHVPQVIYPESELYRAVHLDPPSLSNGEEDESIWE